MFYEGSFSNNKPNGKGRWVFKNGNVLDGDYEQKKKEGEEEEEPPADDGAEDGAPPKSKFNLVWHSATNIADAAHLVNSVEQ